MFADAGTSVSSRLSVNSTNHTGRSRKRFPAACWFEEVLDEYCGSDVEDELAPELDDNPGTTTGTKCSVLHRILSHSWSVVAFDRWPTRVNSRALRRVFCFSTGASFLLQGFFLCSFLNFFAHTDCVLEVHTFAQPFVMDPLVPEFLRCAMCPWRI